MPATIVNPPFGMPIGALPPGPVQIGMLGAYSPIPGMIGGSTEFPQINLPEQLTSKKTNEKLSSFLDRNIINNVYYKILFDFNRPLTSVLPSDKELIKHTYPKIVTAKVNRYNEVLKSIDKNKHFIYE